MTTSFFRNSFITLTAAIAVVSTSAPAAMADEAAHSGYLGALVGANFPTGSRASTTPTVGITAGTVVAPALGVGVYASYFGQTSSGSLLGLPSGSTTTNYSLAGELNYYLPGFHIGADVGVGISSWSGSVSNITASSSSTYLIYGPEAGFDIFLVPAFSVGADAHFLFNAQSNDSANIQAVATAKIWL